jgi:hypothetical protein
MLASAHGEEMWMNGLKCSKRDKRHHGDERKGHISTSRTEDLTEVTPKCLAESRTLSVQMSEEEDINRFQEEKCAPVGIFYILNSKCDEGAEIRGCFINPGTVTLTSNDVGFNPSTQRHYRRLIYHLHIHSYMFRSYDHHQADNILLP